MENKELAQHFFELAKLSQAAGENAFKSRAYSKAAQAILDCSENVSEMEKPQQVEGIGKGIAEKIQQLLQTGTIQKMEDLKKATPFMELLQVPEVGPARARDLYKNHHISTIDQLRQAIKKGEIVDQRIILGLAVLDSVGQEKKDPSTLLKALEPVLKELRKKFPSCQLEIAGSLRRGVKKVGDADLVCSISDKHREEIRETIRGQMSQVLSEGTSKLSGVISGVKTQIRFFSPEEHGAALMYFTGSKEFNIELRNIAISKGLRLNEYGLWRGEEKIAGKTERSIFEALGLPFVTPNNRETTKLIK